MGRDCKYCGAYISDMVDVCPACGKRSKPEKASQAEHWTGSYTAGAAAQAAPEREKRSESSERSQAYTYKQEYERRYGSQTGSTARRPGQQAPPRGASQQSSYDYQGTQATARYTDRQSKRTEDDDVSRNRGISYLSYFGPLFLIPYFSRNNSEFARFHSNQGLLLLLANIAVNACSALPIIGWMISIIGSIFVLCGFINGLINVSRGEKKPLPVIGGITILK
ncbi:MAG: hypothetical protein NC319_06515 [Butyricicoccus sp.]|nr:hypothetical protein [Butyricicoccus sp.]